MYALIACMAHIRYGILLLHVHHLLLAHTLASCTSICMQHAFTVSLFILLRNCKERLEGEHQPDDLCQIQEQKHHLVTCMYIYTKKMWGLITIPFYPFIQI